MLGNWVLIKVKVSRKSQQNLKKISRKLVPLNENDVQGATLVYEIGKRQNLSVNLTVNRNERVKLFMTFD